MIIDAEISIMFKKIFLSTQPMRSVDSIAEHHPDLSLRYPEGVPFTLCVRNTGVS